MMEWVVWWVIVGLLVGVLVAYIDYKTRGYLTVGDILGCLLVFGLLGFVGAIFLAYHTLVDALEAVNFQWLDKKVFVNKEKK